MKKILKKIITATAAAVSSAALSLGCFAQSSGFATQSGLVSSAQTPYDTKYVNIVWSTTQAEAVGVPVAEDTHLLLPVKNTVAKLSEETGETLAVAELDEKVSTDFKGAVLDGTLVQPTRTGLCAINTSDMTLISYRSFGTVTTDVALMDNLAYFGFESDSGYSFMCVDYTDGFRTVWEYVSEDRVSAATEKGDFIIFAAGDKLVVCSSDGSYTENEIGAEIVGTPFAGEYAVFMSAADGNVYKLRLNDDGTAEEDSLMSCEIGGELTSPVVFNGRLYVSSAEGFFILDSLNMQTEEGFHDIKSGTAPVVSYGNGTRIYVTAPLEDYWCLYSIYDLGDENDPIETKLAKMEDFEGGKTAISKGGTMYFRDGNGRVYALEEAEYSILSIVIKLILFLVLIVLIVLWLRFVIKKRTKEKPPFLD